MPVRLYFDHNVNQAVVHGLRLRGLDVVTALEDGADRLPDPDLLGEAQEFVGSVEFLPLR